MIDSTRLGVMVAKFMDEIERDYGEDAELGEFLLVAEVQRETQPGDRGEHLEDKNGLTTDIVVMASEPRNHVQIGMLRSALLEVEQ